MVLSPLGIYVVGSDRGLRERDSNRYYHFFLDAEVELSDGSKVFFSSSGGTSDVYEFDFFFNADSPIDVNEVVTITVNGVPIVRQ
jgi:hypothetical protein